MKEIRKERITDAELSKWLPQKRQMILRSAKLNKMIASLAEKQDHQTIAQQEKRSEGATRRN